MENQQKMEKEMYCDLLPIFGYDSRLYHAKKNNLVSSELKFIDLSTFKHGDDLEKFLKEQLLINDFQNKKAPIIILSVHGDIKDNHHVILMNNNHVLIETNMFINALDKVLKNLQISESRLVLLSCYGEHLYENHELKFESIKEVITADNKRPLYADQLLLAKMIKGYMKIEKYLNQFYEQYKVLTRNRIETKSSETKTIEEKLKHAYKLTTLNTIKGRISIKLGTYLIEYEEILKNQTNEDKSKKIDGKIISFLHQIIKWDNEYTVLNLLNRIKDDISHGHYSDELKAGLVNELFSQSVENKSKVNLINEINNKLKILDIIYANKTERNQVYYEAKFNLFKEKILMYEKELNSLEKEKLEYNSNQYYTSYLYDNKLEILKKNYSINSNKLYNH